ncbi:hypothetical protein BU16DRAFT_563969 [Lophium mytilinum]|uniref:Uncharacterized protein n=1 Tax=Lophium mytilinum TaxID=390894 RepID=A0A6A6QP19_9PEZI|nr:hypothetical protein BU16DRAFT_563969 [Lophium mytilinum]
MAIRGPVLQNMPSSGGCQLVTTPHPQLAAHGRTDVAGHAIYCRPIGSPPCLEFCPGKGPKSPSSMPQQPRRPGIWVQVVVGTCHFPLHGPKRHPTLVPRHLERAPVVGKKNDGVSDEVPASTSRARFQNASTAVKYTMTSLGTSQVFEFRAAAVMPWPPSFSRRFWKLATVIVSQATLTLQPAHLQILTKIVECRQVGDTDVALCYHDASTHWSYRLYPTYQFPSIKEPTSPWAAVVSSAASLSHRSDRVTHLNHRNLTLKVLESIRPLRNQSALTASPSIPLSRATIKTTRSVADLPRRWPCIGAASKYSLTAPDALPQPFCSPSDPELSDQPFAIPHHVLAASQPDNALPAPCFRAPIAKPAMWSLPSQIPSRIRARAIE